MNKWGWKESYSPLDWKTNVFINIHIVRLEWVRCLFDADSVLFFLPLPVNVNSVGGIVIFVCGSTQHWFKLNKNKWSIHKRFIQIFFSLSKQQDNNIKRKNDANRRNEKKKYTETAINNKTYEFALTHRAHQIVDT